MFFVVKINFINSNFILNGYQNKNFKLNFKYDLTRLFIYHSMMIENTASEGLKIGTYLNLVNNKTKHYL